MMDQKINIAGVSETMIHQSYIYIYKKVADIG